MTDPDGLIEESKDDSDEAMSFFNPVKEERVLLDDEDPYDAEHHMLQDTQAKPKQSTSTGVESILK